MASDQLSPDRAAYDAPTGRLLMTFRSIDGIGTLEDWEEFIRFARWEMHRLRVRAYEGGIGRRRLR